MRWPRYLAAGDYSTLFQLLPVSTTIAPITVSGFSRYKTQVAELPPGERQKLDKVTDIIVASYGPGQYPIVAVLLVGHADQDLARGREFEQTVSVERAQRVRDALRRAVQIRARTMGVNLEADEVATCSVGNGARHRVFSDPSSEQQRAQNRRVVIYLAEAIAPIGPPFAIDSFPVPPQKHLGPGALSAKPSPLVSVAFVPIGPVFAAPTFTAPALAGSPVFAEGPPRRPNIRHDHGFLDDGNGNIDPKKRQTPTDQDRSRKEAWTFLLGMSMKFKADELKEANEAYKHFLIDNNGVSQTINYEGFITSDGNGRTVLQSAIDDTRTGVLDLFDRKFAQPATAPRRDSFAATSTPVTVGRVLPDLRYPYPASENWQKAIGGHALWISADVTVDSSPTANTRKVAITMTLHAEDMYNFNPNGADIATNTKDSENGRFEIVGLGHEFLQTGTAARKINFTVPNSKQANNRALPADQVVTT